MSERFDAVVVGSGAGGGVVAGELGKSGRKVALLEMGVVHRTSRYYAVVLAFVLWVMLEYTVFGRELRATGENRAVAVLSGIATRRSLVLAFALLGAVVAIFLVAVGITGLQLLGAESWVTPVFNGLVLLVAVAVSKLAARRRVRHRLQ